MRRDVRRSIAITLVSSWILGSGVPALCAPTSFPAAGRLAGAVVAPGGSSAAGYAVILLDGGGDLVARAFTGADGAYTFEGVGPGDYRLGVADPAGRLAPVSGSPTLVKSGATSRVRIEIRESEGAVRLAPAAYGFRSNSWWDRQTRKQKIFWLSALAVGTGAVVWGVSEALKDDETAASPYTN